MIPDFQSQVKSFANTQATQARRVSPAMPNWSTGELNPVNPSGPSFATLGQSPDVRLNPDMGQGFGAGKGLVQTLPAQNSATGAGPNWQQEWLAQHRRNFGVTPGNTPQEPRPPVQQQPRPAMPQAPGIAQPAPMQQLQSGLQRWGSDPNAGGIPAWAMYFNSMLGGPRYGYNA